MVSSDSLDRGAAVVNLNDDSAPTYAAVDMSKKTKKKDEIPNYAAVDKTKKKKVAGIKHLHWKRLFMKPFGSCYSSIIQVSISFLTLGEKT